MIAVDFFTVDNGLAPALYVLFFIEIASRRVHVAGCTAHPDADWVTQRARQVTSTLGDRPQPLRFVIRDHDHKFTNSFDAVFEAEGARILRTPIRVPEANGIAERFIRTVRSECLDWLLIVNARHLERALTVFIEHYNDHRGASQLGPRASKWSARDRAVVWHTTDDRETARLFGWACTRIRACGVSDRVAPYTLRSTSIATVDVASGPDGLNLHATPREVQWWLLALRAQGSQPSQRRT